MARISLGGLGNQRMGHFDDEPAPRNVRTISSEYGSYTLRYEAFHEGSWHETQTEYKYNDSRYTEVSASTINGMYSAETSGDMGLFDLWDSEESDAINNLKRYIYSKDNFFVGSKDGGSVNGRLLGGNDSAELHSGFNNFLNGNAGIDNIIIYGGGGRVLGGSGDDSLTMHGGQYSTINGNKGNDYIVNWAASQANVRGGSENDTFLSRGGSMNAFGDRGADTFIPFSKAFMTVKDYQPGFDRVDLSYLPSYNLSQSTQGLVVSDNFGQVMLLEGVTSI